MNAIHTLRAGLAGLLLVTGAVQAGGELPVPQDAKRVDERPVAEVERVYPLGGLRKISGQVRMEGKIEARGQLHSVTWELPAERSAAEAFKAARETLQADGGYPLFWCEGRDCGENSLWNDLFGNARLSGSDQDQFFILLRRTGADADTLVALYAITRGNKRTYLHTEQFEANAPLGELLPTPATVLRELRSNARLDYPDLNAEPPQAWVNLLARSLNLDSTLRVVLTGAQAQAWLDQLTAAGVRSARLEVGSQAANGLHVELIR
ncbi:MULTISPECIES: DUF4892 domain-containing protein [unclassified Pseudomonas]|uniref:DUF4892 domain-containing protein n=1 Tax=unclassified Pseudomonas TaxID=196821 RepID=UPI0021C91E31|nr:MULTISPECIES: DUF4892 domain-containing protein [unclassified Pseudomonas]MCU1734767.1 DUF4892 domain-containing protein [Pseudomonas sp. 20P_3.2_Bac4]MCU1745342.1 DUF4892 domain-containing protein [Pseudomonas sp. 20P_3.2_Bac5]